MKPFIFLFVFILFVGVRVQYSSSLREGKDVSFRQLSRSSKLQGQSSLCFVLIEPAGYPCSEHSVYSWFLNSKEQSLGYILADQGFDVWVANVRGTQWSHGHVSLSVENTTTTTITSCSTWHWHQSEVKVLHFSSDGAYLYSGKAETRLETSHYDFFLFSISFLIRYCLIFRLPLVSILYLRRCTLIEQSYCSFALALCIATINFS
ncbi:hypothetical protein MKW94_020910, partial [Papaver nudicaule]|nr:hypothetical protein [Papaver nudicaule]